MLTVQRLPIVSSRGLSPFQKVPRKETRLLWQLLDTGSEGLKELRLTRPAFTSSTMPAEKSLPTTRGAPRVWASCFMRVSKEEREAAGCGRA